MMKIIERTFNAETGEIVDVERNETAAEKKIREQHELEFAAELAAEASRAAQRQALLTRLGITEEEARILLGGN
jgi:hypothetical protein